jgi:processive 1,2-diacylglycerol beta-glucosyltransferase
MMQCQIIRPIAKIEYKSKLTKMTKILILYSSLGSGHISAAKALEEAFIQSAEVEVRCEDALAHANPLYRRMVTEIYVQLSERMPQFYKAYYEGTDIDELEKSLDSNAIWAKLERPFFRQLESLLQETEPDVIVCVQQIPSRLLQLVETQQKKGGPQYVVITDAIAHSSWINYGVSGYFLPNDLSRNFLLQRGINSSILHVTGIPISLEVGREKTQAAARSQLDLPNEGTIITLMGGGLNSKRVCRLVQDLLAYDCFETLIIAAGRNETLLEALENITSTEQVNVRKLGMIDYIDDLIVASDLIITKAGGLITSEILARGKPMVLVDPIPGQEEQNADVIEAAGAGVQLRLLEMVAPAISYLLNSPERLAAMKREAERLGRPNAAVAIAQHILNNWQTDAGSQ